VHLAAFVPDELLEALQGSWGESEESAEPLCLTVAH
jgi:hypothetical protein